MATGKRFAAADPDGGPLNLRDEGRVRVLRALHECGRCTRPELIARTGLSRATVAALITDLIASGVVQENSAADGARRGAGRPAQALSIVPSAAYAAAVDIGHQHLRVMLCDAEGIPVWEHAVTGDVDHTPTQTLDRAAELVRTAIRRNRIARSRVLGLGVAIAAPVDKTGDTLRADGIMADWVDVRPADELTRRTGLAAQLVNDANAGALGEWRYGAARNCDNMIYVRLSAGIGAGIIADGRLLLGGNGQAGEVGHLRAEPGGRVCRCGNRGCLETVASPVAIASLLARSWNRPVQTDELFQLLATGDHGAQRAVEDAGEAVGRCIATMVTLFDPDLIVVGGELATAGETLFEPLRHSIQRTVMPGLAQHVRVLAGELGDQAALRGAACVLLSRVPDVLALVSA